MDLGFLVPGSSQQPRVFGSSDQMLPLGAGTDTLRRQTGIPQWSRMGFRAVAHVKEMTSVQNVAAVAIVGQTAVADMSGAKATAVANSGAKS